MVFREPNGPDCLLRFRGKSFQTPAQEQVPRWDPLSYRFASHLHIFAPYWHFMTILHAFFITNIYIHHHTELYNCCVQVPRYNVIMRYWCDSLADLRFSLVGIRPTDGKRLGFTQGLQTTWSLDGPQTIACPSQNLLWSHRLLLGRGHALAVAPAYRTSSWETIWPCKELLFVGHHERGRLLEKLLFLDAARGQRLAREDATTCMRAREGDDAEHLLRYSIQGFPSCIETFINVLSPEPFWASVCLQFGKGSGCRCLWDGGAGARWARQGKKT